MTSADTKHNNVGGHEFQGLRGRKGLRDHAETCFSNFIQLFTQIILNNYVLCVVFLSVVLQCPLASSYITAVIVRLLQSTCLLDRGVDYSNSTSQQTATTPLWTPYGPKFHHLHAVH